MNSYHEKMMANNPKYREKIRKDDKFIAVALGTVGALGLYGLATSQHEKPRHSSGNVNTQHVSTSQESSSSHLDKFISEHGITLNKE